MHKNHDLNIMDTGESILVTIDDITGTCTYQPTLWKKQTQIPQSRLQLPHLRMINPNDLISIPFELFLD